MKKKGGEGIRLLTLSNGTMAATRYSHDRNLGDALLAPTKEAQRRTAIDLDLAVIFVEK